MVPLVVPFGGLQQRARVVHACHTPSRDNRLTRVCVVVVVPLPHACPQGKERADLVAAATTTKEFKGYTNFGQLKWLDKSIVCANFDLDAKRRVLEEESRRRSSERRAKRSTRR